MINSLKTTRWTVKINVWLHQYGKQYIIVESEERYLIKANVLSTFYSVKIWLILFQIWLLILFDRLFNIGCGK